MNSGAFLLAGSLLVGSTEIQGVSPGGVGYYDRYRHQIGSTEIQGVSAIGATYYDGYKHPDIAQKYQQRAESVKAGLPLSFGQRVAGLALYGSQLTTFDETPMRDGGWRSNAGSGVEWMQHATGINKNFSYCISGALALWALADPDIGRRYPGLFTAQNGNVDIAFENARRLLPHGAVITIDPNDPASLDRLEPGAIVSLKPGLDPANPRHAPHAFIFQGWADPARRLMLGSDANAQDWKIAGDKTTAHEGLRTTIRPVSLTYQAILPSKVMPDSPIQAADLNVTYKDVKLFDARYERPVVTKHGSFRNLEAQRRPENLYAGAPVLFSLSYSR